MSDNLEQSQDLMQGSIVEGTISGITSFGAFVKLNSGVEGLIHISEIANEYVTSIDNFVSLGLKVKVKVLGLNKKNKYDLSLKQATPGAASGSGGGSSRPSSRSETPRPASSAPSMPSAKRMPRARKMDTGAPLSPFDEKMSSFLKKSEEKLIDLKRNIQTKQGVKKRKKR